MTPRLRPGPAATLAHFNAAAERISLLQTELTRVRAVALAWRNGLAALLAGLLGFGLIRGRSDIGDLARPWAVAVGVILLLALVTGAAGGLLLVRAAHGRPGIVPTAKVMPKTVAEHAEALAAARAVRRGRICTLACTGLLVLAVAVAWYGPASASPALLVSTNTRDFCGQVLRSDSGKLMLRTSAGDVTVDLLTAVAIQPVNSCRER